jgi:hypothetical protein
MLTVSVLLLENWQRILTTYITTDEMDMNVKKKKLKKIKYSDKLHHDTNTE